MAGKSLGVAESIPNLEGASVNGTFSGFGLRFNMDF